MSEDRKNLKMTIEVGDKIDTHNCHAFMGVSLTETEDNIVLRVMMVGSMSLSDMARLKQAIENDLIPTIKKEMVKGLLGEMGE